MQVTTIKDSRFYQPLFTYSEVNKLSVASFGLFDLTFIDNFNKVLFNNEIKDLNNLNQIVTVTFGYKQLVFIYENNTNKTLTGTIITHKRDEEKELKYEQFDLPKEFRKKEDIQFFYYCSDFNKQVYFLQLKSTKQVFVKGNNNQFVLGIFNENNEYYKDWHVISDKRLQNIKDIKTNVFNTLFFMEDNKTYICGSYTNGKLIELKINETLLTSEEELQIIKADLRVDGIIILTKSGEIYSTATSLNSFFKNNSKRLQLFGENNFLTQLVIDFKVADIFSIDKELLLVRKEDLKLFILVKNEMIDIQLYLNEIKNIFFSFTEFYLETKKNELIYIEGKEKIIYNCNECTEYSKLKFPKIRGILNFYRYILVFFEEEDLIKRNFNYALNKCDTYKDISINIA